jgi:hypothetical protein
MIKNTSGFVAMRRRSRVGMAFLFNPDERKPPIPENTRTRQGTKLRKTI